MTLSEIYSNNTEMSCGFSKQKRPIVSFEIFPPKNDEDGLKLEKLFTHLDIL